MSEDKLTDLLDWEIKASKEEDRTITAVGSVAKKPDRDRDLVNVDGIKVTNYKKNPVVLFAHNQRELPIGKAKRVWKKDGQLMFKIQFAGEEHNPIAPYIYQQYKDGFLNAFSISFIPDWKTVTYDEKKEARIINDSELLEISAVAVPANADALSVKAFNDKLDKLMDHIVIDDKATDFGELKKDPEGYVSVEEFNGLLKVQNDILALSQEREAEIVALKLQLKDQEIEEETQDDIYASLYDEYVGPSGQEDPEQTGEQTTELTIDDLDDLL